MIAFGFKEDFSRSGAATQSLPGSKRLSLRRCVAA
jgi:hypothetical protein